MVIQLFSVVAGKLYYDRKKKFKSSVWRVVLLCQFLVLAGNRQFFCCGGKVLLRPGKKSSSRLSGGLCCCVSFWFWQEIGFGCIVHTTMYLEYHTVVVLCYFFWFWREIVFGVIST